MNLTNAQKLVKEFNYNAMRVLPKTPTNLLGVERTLSINLIAEESNELLKAIQQCKPEQILDAVCDLLYVILAVPVFMGIEIEPFFNEIHRSNMTKFNKNNKVMLDGNNKIIKGKSYSPPKLHTVFTQIYKKDLYSI